MSLRKSKPSTVSSATLGTALSPCEGCGLCCWHLLVQAGALDVLREPRIDAQRPLGTRHVSLSILDATWVLAGPGMPCPFLNELQRCDIYPTRPSTCVGFAVGSVQCLELRKEHWLPLLRLPVEMHSVLSEIMQAAIEDADMEFGEE